MVWVPHFSLFFSFSPLFSLGSLKRAQQQWGREVAGGGAGRLERGRKLADVTVAAGEKDQWRPSRQRR
jgi:hypothetical protein